MRNITKALQLTADLLVLGGSLHLAYLLRFDFDIPAHEWIFELYQMPLVLAIQLGALSLTGVNAFIWRYIGMRELQAFVKAAAYSAIPILLLRLSLPDVVGAWRVPLAVLVFDTILAFGSVLGIRVLRRALYEYAELRSAPATFGGRKPVLLIGAGRAGMAVAREIQGHADAALEIRGFIDDDPNKLGSVIQAVPVLGSTQDLPRLVAELGIDHVVISLSEPSRRDVRRIRDICESIPVRVRIIPAMHEILAGQVNVSRIRDIQIEDLLGREPVDLNLDALHYLIEGRVVVVTGAGGSIGSELVRQVARFVPGQLLLLERGEPALFKIEQEISHARPDVKMRALIGDVGDESRMRWLMNTYRPEIVLHAAAHKHVPMMEFNATEAIKNNVLATRTLAEIAGECGAQTFVLISTDKAVRPTSIMGASKRMAEIVVQSMNERFPTRYVAVRFGNVIGSTGSVIPVFQEQIRRGGPVTVTHPEMARYFMTIPEATQLVLQAAALGRGGEIFILDMGDPVRILDLAKDTIRLSGLRPYEDVDIEFTGMRPGEKLFEELEARGEHLVKTTHPKIFVGNITPHSRETVDATLARLRVLVDACDDAALGALLAEVLPEAQLGAIQPAFVVGDTAEAAAAQSGLVSQVLGGPVSVAEVVQQWH